ncbi:MAG: caspase family protein [Cyanobacteria bacterium P01_D01_bin.50]
MAPLGIGSSDSSTILKSGQAKLWLLLVGINNYQDSSLPSLRYPALDCQGLEESLVKATEGFPNKEIVVYHDFASRSPILKNIRHSLYRIVSQSQPQDSILLYFSGHGMLEPNTQEAILCLSDTNKNNLLGTGLPMKEVVEMLSVSPAKQQLLCLDTCHSGDMALLGANVGSARDGDITPLSNSTPQLMSVLRQRASQSKGFCALLSCDRGQKSWEFPELGHGVFTYYLMRGLSGEAADVSGFIDADGLYKYVYRQTVQYIDKLNYQVRLINQQKRARGDRKLYREYPQQTPKRIVEGVGELIVGFKPKKVNQKKLRRALIVDGLANRDTSNNISRLLFDAGDFEVECFHQQKKNWSEIREVIQKFTQISGELEAQNSTGIVGIKDISTCLLYLRGYVEEIEDGEARLILGDGVRLSRSYLRKVLRRAQKAQQIVILDLITCKFSGVSSAQNWIEDLQCGTEYGQCLIVTQTSIDKSQLFSQILFETLAKANPQIGLPVAKWIIQLQKLSEQKDISLHSWFSGTQAIIDILPGNIDRRIFQEVQQIRQQKTVVQSPQKSAIPIYVSSAKISSAKLQNDFIIDSEKYVELEKLLKESIGIIAPTILKQSIQKSANHKELVEKLVTYIALQGKAQFKERAQAILKVPTISTQSQLSKSSTIEYQSIDADFISKCECDLIYLIGPIANFIIEEILQSNPRISATEFIDELAQNIPDPKIAIEFKQRILKK